MRSNMNPSSSEESDQKTALEFLEFLARLDVQVVLKEDKLKVSSSTGKVPDELLSTIKSRKQLLVDYFRNTGSEREVAASFAQQRLWFADALAENNSYHLSELLRMHGELKIEILRDVFGVIIERHQILRTRFIEIHGELKQRISTKSLFKFQLVELPKQDHDAAAQVQAWVEAEMHKPFDLQRDSLIRVYLFKESDTSYWLFVNLHHIIADGWSVGVLTREIVALYEDISRGVIPQLAPLSLQYADYSLWQKKQMVTGVFDQQLNYWREKLRGCPTLTLPTDHLRPRRQSTRGTSHSLDLGAEFSGALKAFCKASTASPFMVLLSGFFILMQRYSQQDDIIVGTSIANRNRDEFEPLIGLFVNVLAIRHNLANNPSFEQLVNDIKLSLLDDYENQDVPFEKIVEVCEPKRDPARSPLFQVAFTLENTPSTQLDLGDLRIESVPLPCSTAKYDLTFHVQELSDRFVAEIEYCSDLYSASTIDTMSRCFSHLLTEAITYPESPIGDLKLLSNADLHAIFELGRGKVNPFPNESLVKLFEECAQQFAELPAVIAPEHTPLELWPSISEFYVYDDLLYYAMTNDEKRNQSYRIAINKLVPGKVVLEIGTGPDVILSRFAVEAGARHVYAVELLQETYDKARDTIKRLNLQDKITLIHGDATKVELPEEVDVILSEIVGAIGGSEGCTVIQNQTRKFLKPDGHVIPNRSLTTITPIALPGDFFSEPGFSKTSAPYVEKIFKELGYPFDLRLCVKNMQYADLVANIEPFEDLLFSDHVEEEELHPIHFVFNKDCAIDGFLLWLNLETIDGEWIDTLAHEHCWLPVYVPVFEKKVAVLSGDTITATVERRLCDNGINPTFFVQGTVFRARTKDLVFSVSLDHFTKDFCAHPFHRKLFTEGDARIRPDIYSTVTYAELNSKANQLAHLLRARGLAPGDLAGICLKKSWQSMLAILAILKTGAAYLPIDPDYPKQRIDYIAENSGIDLLLSAKDLAAIWQDFSVPVIDVLATAADVANYGNHNLELAVHAQDLAYVIYTSGSTGNPKGVMIEHASAVNLRQAQARQFGVAAGDRVLQFAPQAFDAAASEWLMALLSGGTLVVPSSAVSGDLDLLADCIRQQRVSVATLPPAVLAVLEPQTVSGLTTVISAGETCTREICNRWSPGRRFFNAYGPTENAVCSTIYECAQWEERDPPIGRVMDNQQAYILDAELCPLPLGVPGELCMAGVGLARGYLNNPQLTKQSFIQVPWTTQHLYRTGDIVKFDETGDIHYLGRRDNQVKIRGYRIELGEVEYQLRNIPEVSEAICVVREENGHKQLYAFVIGNENLAEETLNRVMSQRVPGYMVPARFFVLDEYPITSNGKIDKKALLVMIEQLQGAMVSLLVQPRTENEALFVRWFSEVLGVKSVSVTDNFFDLGGDSILAVHLVAKSRQAGFLLRVSDIFESKTPIALAQISRGRLQPLEAQQGLQTGDVLLTPIQHWFFAQSNPEPHHWNQSLIVTIEKSVTVEMLRASLRELIVHHDALRLQYQACTNSDDSVRQAYSNNLEIELEVVDLKHLDNALDLEQAICEVSQTFQQSFCLGNGHLMKTLLFLTAPNLARNRLAMIAHHLIVDVHSWRIILEDIERLIEEGTATIPLAEKTTSFQCYAQRLQDYVNGRACQANLSYWQDVIEMQAGDQMASAMATEAGEQQHIPRRESVSVSLDAATSELLGGAALKAYHTQVLDLLIVALRQAVHVNWNLQQFSVVLENHGRQDFDECVDVSRTVGWFTTQYPLVFSDNVPNLNSELIKQTKETLRAIPNRGFDYAALRYLHSNPNVRRSLTPVTEPSVLINYLGQMERQQASDAFELLDTTPGENIGAQNSCSHPLAITAKFKDDRFELDFTFDNTKLSESKVRTLADTTRVRLSDIVQFCSAQTQPRHTPSDFPLAVLSQAEVDTLDDAHTTLTDIWPLTKSQQGMFFCTLASEGKAFVEQMVLEILGDLNLQKFAAAWTSVQYANPLLNSRVHMLKDSTYFVIQKDEVVPLLCKELSIDKGASLSQQALLEYAKRTREVGFDLQCEPGCRLETLTIEPSRYALVLTVSHVLMDGWSHANLMSQLLSAYNGKGLSAPQFSGYLHWLQQRDREESSAYWKQLVGQSGRVSQANKLCETKLVEQLVNESQIVSVSTLLTEEDLHQLDDLTRCHGLLLNALLQAAWGLLIGAYTQQKHAVFGYTTSGRPDDLADANKMIGLFINTLPIVLDIDDDDVWSLAGKVQQQILEHSAHQYLSAAEIQIAAGQADPLYDSLLVFENYPLDDVSQTANALGLKQIVHHPIEGGETTSPLTLLIKPETSLFLELVFDAARMDAAQMTQLVEDYKTILLQLIRGESQIPALFTLLGPRQKPMFNQLETLSNVMPASEMEYKVQGIYRAIIGVQEVGVEERFFDIGGHSLLALQLLQKINDTFSCNLSVGDLFLAPNIRALSTLITQQQNAPASVLNDTLVPLSISVDAQALYFVAGVGGSCISFFSLVRSLSKVTAAFGLQPPQLNGNHSVVFTSVSDYASHYIEALQTEQQQGPFRLVGHSFGSFIAFEMALQLEARGHQVALVLLDTPAPVPGRIAQSTHSVGQLRYRGLKIVAGFAGFSCPFTEAEFSGLSAAEQDLRIETLCAQQQIPFNATTLRNFLDVYVNQSSLDYAPIGRLQETPITLINAADTREFFREHELDDLGWREFTAATVSVCVTPGDHLSMLHDPHVKRIVDYIHSTFFGPVLDSGQHAVIEEIHL